MSNRGGYPVHNADDPSCMCWSCENSRRVKAAELRDRAARDKALVDAVDLVVIHVTKDVYELHLGEHSVNGRLVQILTWQSPAIDAFLGLPLLEQNELLQRARDRKLQRIRVGDMTFSKDAPAEETTTRRRQ